MAKVPDAWDDAWSEAADGPTTQPESAPSSNKKSTSKQSKAQRRAQQAEFNRQLWAEAEGPRETNFFLSTRNVVPLQQEFKPPTVLLSRKGPPIQQQTPKQAPLVEGMGNLDLATKKDESSEDEEDVKERQRLEEERKTRAKQEREEKQRKYDERRQELFGTGSTSGGNVNGQPNNRSGNSSPGSLTPPGSRSATPNRGRGGRARGRGGALGQGGQMQRNGASKQELFDPSFAPKPQPDRRASPKRDPNVVHPIRMPKGPDASGNGFGGIRGDHQHSLSARANSQAIGSTP